MSAEPSMMMASPSGSLSGRVSPDWRISVSCDFWDVWSLPLSLSEAGAAWFSCLKKDFQINLSDLTGDE